MQIARAKLQQWVEGDASTQQGTDKMLRLQGSTKQLLAPVEKNLYTISTCPELYYTPGRRSHLINSRLALRNQVSHLYYRVQIDTAHTL